MKIEVARKPKAAAATNGDTNGVHGANGAGIKRKRSRSPEESDIQEQHGPKTAKILKTSITDDLIVLGDSGNGAILIDD